MSQTGPHRKRVKHYHEPGDIHKLTFSCYRRMQLLTDDSWRKLLCEAIDRAVERHHFRLFAFVLMPEHVHLIVQPREALLDKPAVAPDDTSARDTGNIEKLLFAIKRPYSYRIKQRLIEQRSTLLQKTHSPSAARCDDVPVLAGGTGIRSQSETGPDPLWQPSTAST